MARLTTTPESRLVGNITIPKNTFNHRFIQQITKFLEENSGEENSRDRVIGTSNTHSTEIYGWSGHIDWHTDNQGIVYLLILNEVTGVFQSKGEPSISYKQGSVIRMNDYNEHKVDQKGIAVALFIGAFKEEQDKKSIALLKKGLSLLNNPSTTNYYTAPRWNGAPMLNDECFVLNNDNAMRSLASDFEKNKEEIITCSEESCNSHANQLDQHFPYFWENNLCSKHANGQI